MLLNSYPKVQINPKEPTDTGKLNRQKKRPMNLLEEERQLDGGFVEIKLVHKTWKTI